MDYLTLLTLGIAVILVGAVVWLLAWWSSRRGNESLNLQLLLVKVSRKTGEEDKDFIKQINFSEQLYSALAAINQPIVLEASVHNAGEEIYFYLAVPRTSVEFAKREIQGLFLEAQVDEVSDYTIFDPTSAAVGGYLTLSEDAILPIRTYRESEVDTFAPVLSPLSKLNEYGDGASIQLIIQPLKSGFKDRAMSAIDSLKKGTRFKDVLRQGVSLKDVGEAFNTKKKPEEGNKVVDEEAIKALQAKISKPLFSVNIRVATASESRDRAEEILLSLAGAFSQFAAPLRNSFKLVKPRNLKSLFYQYIFREFNSSQSFVLNAEELASVFHLPVNLTDVPRVKWLSTKDAPPPAELPSEGVTIGESVFRGDRKVVRMTDDDRRRHLYVVGQTGTGKSYLMLNMVAQDMKDNKGLCVIDPHGDLIDKILPLVPTHRIDDVIVFDPGDVRRPLGLNMLEYNFDRPEEKTFIVNEIQSIFNRLFDKETMGPMFERYMRNALLLLMEDAVNEPATMMEVPRIFTDQEFRERKLQRITNPAVFDFWTKEAVKATGESGLANMAPYITSKFDNFISNDYVRPIIGQTHSAFNFRQVMDEGKILLVNLSKGRIGDINAGLLGMIITGRLLMAALARADADEADRRDFYLYIDEFQNFTTDSISVILSEARKYKLDLIITHQFIAQLTDQIRESVFGNVGSIVSFRVGAPDAEVLVKQFAPVFNEKDLITVENQNAFAKLLLRGEPSKPFNIKTLPVTLGSPEIKEKLKELSRLTYGRDLSVVEREIFDRLRG